MCGRNSLSTAPSIPTRLLRERLGPARGYPATPNSAAPRDPPPPIIPSMGLQCLKKDALFKKARSFCSVSKENYSYNKAAQVDCHNLLGGHPNIQLFRDDLQILQAKARQHQSARTPDPQVRPVVLPTRCPHPGEACVVSGWGLVSHIEPGTTRSPQSQVSLPDTLHCANISIISDTSCDKSYPGRLTNTMVCAGAEGRGAESCEGDSGGPLVCGGVLQGIVSWGDVPCDNTTKPGVYTKVCHYLKWIRETMKRN
uniref:kallikrein-15 n=1 Tax=Macaca mulatta TaxID=9544 RepID=UPI0010A1F909|nr:kallikrein-15 [Macaca mulatta]